MGLTQKLKNNAMGLSQKALEKLLADEKRAMRLGVAIGKVQQGKAAVDKGQEQLLRTLNFASRSDFKALGKRLSVLRRRMRELEEQVSRLS